MDRGFRNFELLQLEISMCNVTFKLKKKNIFGPFRVLSLSHKERCPSYCMDWIAKRLKIAPFLVSLIVS